MSFIDIPKVQIFCDNKGSIELAKNPVHHKRSKHIDIRHHFIREHIRNGTILINYVPTKDNIADLFTKAVPQANFLKYKLVE